MSGSGRAWTLAITSIAFFMVLLDALVVVTALPAMHRELGVDLAALAWTINAFTLAFAAGIITAAALGDRFGRRRIFTTGLLVFTAASAACALAGSLNVLIAARVVQGIGAALVMPLSLTILVSSFPAERRGTIVGIWGALGGLAVASGPLIGGAVTQGLDWHWIFWVNVPIGVVATALALSRLTESRGPATRLDPVAVVLVGAGATSLVWGLIRAGEIGWGTLDVVTTLAVGAVLSIGFIAWEARATEPMLPLRLFGSRAFAAAATTSLVLSGSIFSAVFLIAQYFQVGLGYSPMESGLRLLPWTAMPLVFTPISGALSDRIGRRTLLVAGLLLEGAGLAWIAALATTNTAYGLFVVPFLVAGIGVSIALPLAPTAVMSAVAPADMGKASGVNSTMQRFGAAFAVAIASAVFAANGHLGSAASFTDGFRPALTVVSGLAVLGAIVALGVRMPARAQVDAAVAAARAA